MTDFIAQWRVLKFQCPKKFTQQKVLHMYLDNFRYNLSTALIPQTIEGFNNLRMKAHEIEIHFNKRKKNAKESSGKTERLLTTTIALQGRAQYTVGSSFI